MAKQGFEARAGEQVFAEKVSANCLQTPSFITNPVAGKMYFTDQRVVFLAQGLIGTDKMSWGIEMKDIAAVKACIAPPFFPIGMRLILKNGEKYKLSIMKRNKYIDWISQHIS